MREWTRMSQVGGSQRKGSEARARFFFFSNKYITQKFVRGRGGGAAAERMKHQLIMRPILRRSAAANSWEKEFFSFHQKFSFPRSLRVNRHADICSPDEPWDEQVLSFDRKSNWSTAMSSIDLKFNWLKVNKVKAKWSKQKSDGQWRKWSNNSCFNEYYFTISWGVTIDLE